jgi:hypothetical protein
MDDFNPAATAAEGFLDDPESDADVPEAPYQIVPSTSQTRARWAEILVKRRRGTWQEGKTLFRYGRTGTTAWNLERWGRGDD